MTDRRQALIADRAALLVDIRRINRQLKQSSNEAAPVAWATRAQAARAAKLEQLEKIELELSRLKAEYHLRLNAAFVARCRQVLEPADFDEIYAWAESRS